MAILILSVLVVLAALGCGCVVWAARGGPRWARGVAATTLAAGELARGVSRSSRKWNGGEGVDGDGSGGA
ncbi:MULTISPECIES: hypothetical protein [unclassified Streptomyces]|uniref:hypothetical protein n=1 Tax=unclassified Streptomyces TaxID=2593676 RepID=UPI002E354439|nr:hypothetical protein [Streptomyces sp. NBC_01268]